MICNVILSGGVGSRLWPLSRKSSPKQYLALFDGRSLFELTLLRNKIIAENCVIVGNKDNYQLSDLGLANAGISNATQIIEAAPKNTAAAIAFACYAVQPSDILIVTPSDHIIADEKAYQEAVAKGIQLAELGYLVTFGVKPSRPETGYGYIEYQNNDVTAFREKPDAATAEKYLASGNFCWNSGIFCFQAGVYLQELQAFEPEIAAASLAAWNARNDDFLPETETALIPSQSIDYAVMERSNKIKVVPADFGWSDLGSFESIWEYLETQKDTHSFQQNHLVLGTKKHVEILGLDNLVVIDTPDALLIMPKALSQQVKGIYERLEKVMPELVN